MARSDDEDEGEGERTLQTRPPDGVWIGAAVEPPPEPLKRWVDVDPRKAVALPGTYFGFYHGPQAWPCSREESLADAAPRRGSGLRAWKVAIAVLLGLTAGFLTFLWM